MTHDYEIHKSERVVLMRSVEGQEDEIVDEISNTTVRTEGIPDRS